MTDVYPICPTCGNTVDEMKQVKGQPKTWLCGLCGPLQNPNYSS